MLTMIYMTRIQNMSFLILKVNNPSVRHPVWPVGPPSGLVGHPVWSPSGTPSGTPVRHPHPAPSGPPSGTGTPSGPCRAPLPAPSGTPSSPHPAPSGTPSGRHRVEKKKKNFFFFGCCCRLEKRAKNISVFGFQSPSSPSSTGFASEAARRRRFFWPSSPSHPSELYSSPWVA
jgi:hypothetical protein